MLPNKTVDEILDILGIYGDDDVDVHPSSHRFYSLALESMILHAKKQKDYGIGDDPFANVRGSARWGIPPWVGACVRLNDKVVRLQSFAVKGTLENESVEDSLIDISVYALIARVLYEQEAGG